jgi:transcriptional antiterminator NusG
MKKGRDDSQSRESLGLLEENAGTEKEKVVTPIEPMPSARTASLLTLLPVDENEAEVAAGTLSALTAVLTSRYDESGKVKIRMEVSYSFTAPGEGAEWRIWWILANSKKEEIVTKTFEKEMTVNPNTPLPLTFEVEAPVGVRYNDRVELRISTTWVKDGGNASAVTLKWVTRQALLAIKTFRGYEREVADTIQTKANENPGMIFALLVPSAIRGYVFAEGMSFEGVSDMLKGIRKARGLVKGETTLKEVEPLLAPKVTVEGFVEGAIVELVSGPFKGEKARVKKIDQEKEQITVELIEAVVPIPVTVRGDHVRMVEKSGG